MFKRNFEGLLKNCEYYEDENIKKKIDSYLKKINLNSNSTKQEPKNNENFCEKIEQNNEFPQKTENNEFSQKTQIFQDKKSHFLVIFLFKIEFLLGKNNENRNLLKRPFNGEFNFKTIQENEMVNKTLKKRKDF